MQTLEGRERDPAGGDHPERRAARSSTSSTPATRRRRGRSRSLYASGEEAAVTGVKPGERVVLDGRQNLRPGATVIERAAGGAARAAGAASAPRRGGFGAGSGAAGPALGRAGVAAVDEEPP